MKMKSSLILFYLLPCNAVLKPTKYKVSNLTRTLILASSPFISLPESKDSFSFEYGSPSDTGPMPDIVDNESEKSEIYEVRVLPPTASNYDRSGKSLDAANSNYQR